MRTAQYAAVAVLALTFLLLGSRWSRTRFEGDGHGRLLPRLQALVDSRAWTVLGQSIGLACLATFLWFAGLGPDDSALNPAPTWLYVWAWVGLALLSVVFGPVTRWLNPWRTLTAAIRRVTGGAMAQYPERWGQWPAAVTLLVFVWLELVKTDRDHPFTVLLFVLIYGGVQILGGVRYGGEWHDKADGFEVYSTLAGRLSCLRRRADGRLVVGNPFRNLAATEVLPGTAAAVYVLLGSTAFDGLTRTQLYAGWTDGVSGVPLDLLGTVGLLGCVLLVAAAFTVACRLTRLSMANKTDRSTGAVQREFVHSLIPVTIGYTVAHYFSLLIFQGQAGWLLLGSPDDIDYGVVSASAIGVVQVAAILLGHVVGVVAAHDRAVGVLAEKEKRIGQYPVIVCMMAFTFVGIGLLLGA